MTGRLTDEQGELNDFGQVLPQPTRCPVAFTPRRGGPASSLRAGARTNKGQHAFEGENLGNGEDTRGEGVTGDWPGRPGLG